MRLVMMAGLAALAIGCDGSMVALDEDFPVLVTATVSLGQTSNPATITAQVENRGGAPVVLAVRCTAIELDRRSGGNWQRIEDLRQCTPPNQTTVPAHTTVEIVDVRMLDAGEYRVVVASPDGHQAVSPSIAVAAGR